MEKSEESGVIVFDNLMQSSAVVGVNDVVRAQVIKPFAADNAHGLLREVKDHNEVAGLAAAAGKKTLEMLRSGIQ
uniref:Uncharacterized protein n=1 Tax=Candidatus Nitrotoga fabula TaxID=2182327 RepID=A0A2X0RBK9_9PROT|nr:protein of unknown function [Candidatus Nitrotoga fabula]